MKALTKVRMKDWKNYNGRLICHRMVVVLTHEIFAAIFFHQNPAKFLTCNNLRNLYSEGSLKVKHSLNWPSSEIDVVWSIKTACYLAYFFLNRKHDLSPNFVALLFLLQLTGSGTITVVTCCLDWGITGSGKWIIRYSILSCFFLSEIQ